MSERAGTMTLCEQLAVLAVATAFTDIDPLAIDRARMVLASTLSSAAAGYDIESSKGEDPLLFIEVKGRIAGADDFYVTHTEVRHGQNAIPNYRLALVSVDPRGPEHDQIRYLANPFDELKLGSFDVEGIRGHWAKTWAKGSAPF